MRLCLQCPLCGESNGRHIWKRNVIFKQILYSDLRYGLSSIWTCHELQYLDLLQAAAESSKFLLHDRHIVSSKVRSGTPHIILTPPLPHTYPRPSIVTTVAPLHRHHYLYTLLPPQSFQSKRMHRKNRSPCTSLRSHASRASTALPIVLQSKDIIAVPC